MASITSTATGNWAAGGTWVGGVAPGNGDTAIIANGHVVTIAAGTSVTVGDSANPTTPAIQTATAGNGTGRLIVDTTASLTVKGNVVQGNATWQFNAGSALHVTHASANLTWQISDANSQANAKLVFNGGTGSNRITVNATSAAGGGFGWFGTAWVDSGRVEATGVQFTSIGTSTLPAFLFRASSVYVGFWDDCLFTSCGAISTQHNAAAGAVVRLRRSTIRTPVSSTFKVLELGLAAGVHTGITFDRLRWEGTLSFFGATGASGVSWTDCVGSSYGATGQPLGCTVSVPHAGVVTGLFLFNKIAASGNPSQLMNGTITNLCSMRQGSGGNGHAMEIKVDADTVISQGVWECGDTDFDGDQLQIGSNPATVKTLEVTQIIQPSCPDGTTGAGAFINTSAAGSIANQRLNIHHNTVFSDAASGPAGSVITENTTGGAGVWTAVRDNIFYRTVSGAGWVVYQVNGALTNGTFTNVGYNDRYNLTSDGYSPADVAFTSPSPPGTGDLTVNPAFVDGTRRFLSWGKSVNPSLTTIQQVVDELMKRNDDAGYAAGFTIDAYLAYLRAGFTPTASALATAGHDGSVMGAVAPAITAALTLTPELQLYLSGVWTNVLDDVRGPIICEYGIQGSTPADRVASTGTLEYPLDNSAGNSGGVVGYYSPLHASKRAGFGFNIPVRLKLTAGAYSAYKFRGSLADIIPTAGLYDERLVACTALDWMDDAAQLDLPDLAAQLSQRPDQILTTILDALAVADQPVARSIETGAETYDIALDGGATGTRPKVREVLNQLALSELGYVYVKGDPTTGGVFTFEGRHHRIVNPTVQITLPDTVIERGGLAVPGSRDEIYSSVQVFVRPTKVDAAATTILYDLQTTSTLIQPGETTSTLFGPYRDPDTHEPCGGTDMQVPVSGTDFLMNTAQDGSGANVTANFVVTPSFTGLGVRWSAITNTGAVAGYVTRLRAVGKAIRRYDAMIEVAIPSSYGTRVLTLDMPYQNSTNVATDVGTYLAQLLAAPFAHVPRVRFLANKSATLMAAAINREPGDRMALSETVTGVNAEFTINAVRLELQAPGLLWCTWGLEPGTSQRSWLLGTVGVSELDDATYLGF